MFYIILTLLTGISFFPLLFPDHPNFKIWHAQGMWVQTLIMIAFSWSFFQNRINNSKSNIPLGLLHLWVGGSTAFVCALTQMNGSYNYWTLFPYFNFLCLIMLYKLIVDYLTIDNIYTILKWLRYVIIITLIMCVLQYIGVSQFFRLQHPDSVNLNGIVTGFIGNGTHLSGYLAMCLPLFLWNRSREDFLAIVLLGMVLFLSGTTVGDPAISGFIISLFVLFYMAERKLSKAFIVVLGLCVGILMYLKNPLFVVPTGRIGLWSAYLPIAKGRFILGNGLGTVKFLSARAEFPDAHHLHLEYYQYLIELGFIGLLLVGNIIVEFMKKAPSSRTDKVLKAIVYGFLLSCCFTFPSHLWLPSTLALFAYAAFNMGEYSCL